MHEARVWRNAQQLRRKTGFDIRQYVSQRTLRPYAVYGVT